LANEWIEFGEQFAQENKSTTLKVHGRKSVICKFVQAKLKAIARRRAAAKCVWFRDINDGVVADFMPEILIVRSSSRRLAR
jgi:hypothetical protein